MRLIHVLSHCLWHQIQSFAVRTTRGCMQSRKNNQVAFCVWHKKRSFVIKTISKYMQFSNMRSKNLCHGIRFRMVKVQKGSVLLRNKWAESFNRFSIIFLLYLSPQNSLMWVPATTELLQTGVAYSIEVQNEALADLSVFSSWKCNSFEKHAFLKLTNYMVTILAHQIGTLWQECGDGCYLLSYAYIPDQLLTSSNKMVSLYILL